MNLVKRVEQMKRLVVLVGESGCGKTTITKYFEEKYGIDQIESYTTRKPRFEGEKYYQFVDVPEFHRQMEAGNVLEHTNFNGNYYWTGKDKFDFTGTKFIIVDPVGVQHLKEKLPDMNMTVIYLKTNENVRYARMITERTPESAQSRIEHDRGAFKFVECNYVVDTDRPIEEVYELIGNIIGVA